MQFVLSSCRCVYFAAERLILIVQFSYPSQSEGKKFSDRLACVSRCVSVAVVLRQDHLALLH
jgi:hypothetical protein